MIGDSICCRTSGYIVWTLSIIEDIIERAVRQSSMWVRTAIVLLQILLVTERAGTDMARHVLRQLRNCDVVVLCGVGHVGFKSILVDESSITLSARPTWHDFVGL